MLNWEPGSLTNWQPHEIEFQAEWHQTLENSSTILPPTPVQLEPRPEDVELVNRATQIYN
jgi:hypothetical protein